MHETLKKLFTKDAVGADHEILGEDMTPPPATLKERSTLTLNDLKSKDNKGPFISAPQGPMRDFTG